ncbi:hypothetical protein Tco_1138429 [Tanacetum coccineum]
MYTHADKGRRKLFASISCSTAAAVIGAASPHKSAVAPLSVAEFHPEPLTTVLVEMKHVQPMSLSMPPVKRYNDPESGCESYMPVAHSELPNSIPLNVPKPFEKLRPPALLIAQSPGETVYPRSIRRLSVIIESVCPEHPRSQHKYPKCPPPEPQQARSL